MSKRPAEIAGVAHKGAIALGNDADFAFFAPGESYVVDVHKLHHKNPISPYQGKALAGKVHRTFVRGTEVDFKTPKGQLIRRGDV